jgi:hypothetical protein
MSSAASDLTTTSAMQSRPRKTPTYLHDQEHYPEQLLQARAGKARFNEDQLAEAIKASGGIYSDAALPTMARSAMFCSVPAREGRSPTFSRGLLR